MSEWANILNRLVYKEQDEVDTLILFKQCFYFQVFTEQKYNMSYLYMDMCDV